jgi:hypothetical protein
MILLFSIKKVSGYARGNKNLLFFGGFKSGLGLQIYNIIFWVQFVRSGQFQFIG